MSETTNPTTHRPAVMVLGHRIDIAADRGYSDIFESVLDAVLATDPTMAWEQAQVRAENVTARIACNRR